MTGDLIVIIISICGILIFAGLVSVNILLSIMIKSNKSGDSKCDFYQNAKQPIQIHVLSLKERYRDMQENPEQYGVIKIL